MPERLQVAPLIAGVLREPRVGGDEQRGDGPVIRGEGSRSAAEEEETGRRADRHVRAVGEPGDAAAAGRRVLRRGRGGALPTRAGRAGARVQPEPKPPEQPERRQIPGARHHARKRHRRDADARLQRGPVDERAEGGSVTPGARA